MELNKYIGKYVKIELKNGYYYIGKVLGVHDKDISIKDKYGKFVDIVKDMILLVVEVEK